MLVVSLAIVTASRTGAATPQETTITLATTTSFVETGLAQVLVDKFREETGIAVRPLPLGTGEALRTGREGRADVMVVHAPAQEQKMVDEGYAIERVTFMHNTFLIVGPAADPAGVGKAASELDAFKAIAKGKHRFISRGDKSGTHSKELSIWDKAGIKAKGQSWYVETGQGMGETLLVADQKRAYCLSDVGTYLAFKAKKRIALARLSEKGDMLYNPYSVMLLNPEKFKKGQIRVQEARQFAAFLVRSDILDLIGDYKRQEYGEPLFTPHRPKKQ